MSAVLIDPAALSPDIASELASIDCFHCGLPLPPAATGQRWSVRIGQVSHAMCCPGCAAVAQTIVDSGYADYYTSRTAFSNRIDGDALVPPELQLYDDEDGRSQFVTVPDNSAGPVGDLLEATLALEGIRCAACVWLIEQRLARLPGLQLANLNVASERLHIRWDKTQCKPSDILLALREIGYSAYPFDAVRQGERLRKSGKRLFRQTFIAGLCMMQVMMYAAPAYFAAAGSIDHAQLQLMRWASLLLTLPVLCYSALPFLRGAWIGMKLSRFGMDLPVAIGIVAAFAGSAVATVRGSGEVYFDTVTMFVFLLLCSRYLELTARRKAASTLERLQHALPDAATRLLDYPRGMDGEVVAATRLVKGDLILVKPGEVIAADGVLLSGRSSVDISLLTGESKAVSCATGDTLPGGAVNCGQAMVLRVSRVVRESTLSALLKLAEQATQNKPRIAQWADQVAGWFVAALLLCALLAFCTWQWLDPSRAWPIAIAVLVVSCPCALSLATPSALAAATDRLVRNGVLIVQPHVLETLHRATYIIFDKTGTLTKGKPVLQQITAYGAGTSERYLQVAAAMEISSAHPLGRAIADAACGRPTQTSELRDGTISQVAGKGVEAEFDGILYRLGSASFVAELAGVLIPAAAPEEITMTPVFLGKTGSWLARFDLADEVREDARQTLAYFQRRGKKVILLSGDDRQVAQHVARELAMDGAYGEHSPAQKLAFVQALQRRGETVAMVGDGVNDAAVLGVADVSFAMGAGAALAQIHADTVLMSDRLSALADTARLGNKTMHVIRQNLAWASIYNLLAIPAAALGLLNPWLSAVGMSFSSALVVINALWLRNKL
ncbi:Cu2+-exporting ATPase [Collimonas sp. OK307]|uniref:heavy metal translocating P-type ATPase n=1 Tax=Collimonas sp. OK307 TaxID=1801620 RepID=UPI0008DF1DC5|nr:heavy metal translocating P-type ATPase [Collimonas sp. OK307]SFI35729.1 Cu2+-exporting ATPase [Collimonas sp. OK307]